MAYLRISEPAVGPVVLADLGYTVPISTSNFLISDQFSVEDLQNSTDFIAAIQGGSLTAQVNLDGTWTPVVAASFNGDDVYAAYANIYEISNTEDNQRLVNNTDASTGTQLHHHDSRYYTQSQLGSTTLAAPGASLVGVYSGGWSAISGSSVQAAFNSIDGILNGGTIDLDRVYTNDVDGLMSVNGTSKPLNLQSNNVNDIIISRKSGTDIQDLLRADVSASEIVLGSAAVGALAQANVHITTNLVIDGDLSFTGSITDTTVNHLDVTNATITMRNGAVTDANASLNVLRPVAGTEADLLWDEVADRWKAGVVGSEQTIALLEASENVTSVWNFAGSATTAPNMTLTNKTAAATTNLGAAGVMPVELINGQLSVYDKTNSRNKFLTVARYQATFAGRDSTNNKNEYLRTSGGAFVSNKTGLKVIQACTLVGISLESASAAAWTARVRKNYLAADVYTKATAGTQGVVDSTLNIDLAAGDTIQVYLDSGAVNVDRPNVVLEYAYRF